MSNPPPPTQRKLSPASLSPLTPPRYSSYSPIQVTSPSLSPSRSSTSPLPSLHLKSILLDDNLLGINKPPKPCSYTNEEIIDNLRTRMGDAFIKLSPTDTTLPLSSSSSSQRHHHHHHHHRKPPPSTSQKHHLSHSHFANTNSCSNNPSYASFIQARMYDDVDSPLPLMTFPDIDYKSRATEEVYTGMGYILPYASHIGSGYDEDIMKETVNVDVPCEGGDVDGDGGGGGGLNGNKVKVKEREGYHDIAYSAFIGDLLGRRDRCEVVDDISELRQSASSEDLYGYACNSDSYGNGNGSSKGNSNGNVPHGDNKRKVISKLCYDVQVCINDAKAEYSRQHGSSTNSGSSSSSSTSSGSNISSSNNNSNGTSMDVNVNTETNTETSTKTKTNSDLKFNSFFESGNMSTTHRIYNRATSLHHLVLERERECERERDTNASTCSTHTDFNSRLLDVDMEYDITLKFDTHTMGNVQWFYFSASSHSLTLPASASSSVSSSASRAGGAGGARDGSDGSDADGGKYQYPYPLNVRFNIVNMMKSSSLYEYGMRPLVYSTNAQSWSRSGTSEIAYYLNKASYYGKAKGSGKGRQSKNKSKSKRYSTLSFVYAFTGEDVVYFAHCFPYTYSDLKVDLMNVVTRSHSRAASASVGAGAGAGAGANDEKLKFIRSRDMCTTLSGNRCEILTITSYSTSPREMERRPAIFISARVHPGESNSSYMLRGLLKYLCSGSRDAQSLRDNFVFKIAPMLNPDGVIHGNYRTSLAGVDLNRRYLAPSALLHPEIHAFKATLKKTREARGVLMFVDLHGHSRKKNAFIYACDGERSRLEQRMLPRVFPRLMHNLFGWSCSVDGSKDEDNGNHRGNHRGDGRDNGRDNGGHNGSDHGKGDFFNYKECDFKVKKGKCGTGRVVAFNDCGIDLAFTLEASFAGVGDNSEQKQRRGKAKNDEEKETNEEEEARHFGVEAFEGIGIGILKTLLHYCRIGSVQSTLQNASNESNDNDSESAIPPPPIKSASESTHYSSTSAKEDNAQAHAHDHAHAHDYEADNDNGNGNDNDNVSESGSNSDSKALNITNHRTPPLPPQRRRPNVVTPTLSTSIRTPVVVSEEACIRDAGRCERARAELDVRQYFWFKMQRELRGVRGRVEQGSASASASVNEGRGGASSKKGKKGKRSKRSEELDAALTLQRKLDSLMSMFATSDISSSHMSSGSGSGSGTRSGSDSDPSADNHSDGSMLKDASFKGFVRRCNVEAALVGLELNSGRRERHARNAGKQKMMRNVARLGRRAGGGSRKQSKSAKAIAAANLAVTTAANASVADDMLNGPVVHVQKRNFFKKYRLEPKIQIHRQTLVMKTVQMTRKTDDAGTSGDRDRDRDHDRDRDSLPSRRPVYNYMNSGASEQQSQAKARPKLVRSSSLSNNPGGSYYAQTQTQAQTLEAASSYDGRANMNVNVNAGAGMGGYNRDRERGSRLKHSNSAASMEEGVEYLRMPEVRR